MRSPMIFIAGLALVACQPLEDASKNACQTSDDCESDYACAQGTCLREGSIAGEVVMANAAALTPVDGAVCTLEGTNKNATTNSAGEFLIHGVARGAYLLICRSEDSLGARYYVLVPVEVAAGEHVVTGVLTLEPPGAITGSVRLAGVSNRNGVTVSIPGTSYSATSANDGSFVIDEVPAGTYSLNYAHAGFRDATVSSVIVLPNVTATVPELVLDVSTGATGSIAIDGVTPNENGVYEVTDTEVTVAIFASTDATLLQLSEDSAFVGASWEAMSETHPWTFSATGTHQLYVRFADANGLASAPFAITVAIADEVSDAPVCNADPCFVDPAGNPNYPGTFTHTTDYPLIAYVGNAVEYAVSIGPDFTQGAWVALQNPTDFDQHISVTLPSSDGTYDWRVVFRNAAGVTGANIEGTVVLDSVAPEATIVGASANAIMLTVTIEASEHLRNIVPAGTIDGWPVTFDQGSLHYHGKVSFYNHLDDTPPFNYQLLIMRTLEDGAGNLPAGEWDVGVTILDESGLSTVLDSVTVEVP